MKSKITLIVSSILIFVLLGLGSAGVQATAKNPLDKKVEIDVRGASVLDVLTLIARNAGLKLRYEEVPQGEVSFGSTNSTLYDLLKLVTRKNGLTFSVTGDQLMIHSAHKASRSVASVPTDGEINLVRLNYAKASMVAPKIADFFAGKNLKLSADDLNNTIVIGNAGGSIHKIRRFVAQLDLVPQQILIEAKIVETSGRFIRDIGMSWGNIGVSAGSRGSFGVINNGVPSNPNLALGYRFGLINQSALDVKLSAAETRGEAKIISRPKIVTADRYPALIKSGITYYIKTLTRESDQPSNSSQVSGGLTSVSAGLNLEVTPTVVENSRIQLNLNIANSEADPGNAIDGIPGIVNSSARTSIMVKQGSTATIAGLIKYNDSTKENGVPILSWIPLLGNLFKGISKDRQNRELVIFITPTLVSANDEEIQEPEVLLEPQAVEEAAAASLPSVIDPKDL
jgi:type IV pilus assembly protein PilQ